MIVISRVWTGGGDTGHTHLADMSRVPKTDARIAACGDADEVNSVLGTALVEDLPEVVGEILAQVQNELFDLGADLATPVMPDPAHPPLRIDQAAISRLEAWCDEFSEELPTLRSFILPGGNRASAALHHARTVARRAERTAWAAVAAHGDSMNPLTVTYLNRLSDLLFVLARSVGQSHGERLWVPGADRTPPDARARRNRDRIIASTASGAQEHSDQDDSGRRHSAPGSAGPADSR